MKEMSDCTKLRKSDRTSQKQHNTQVASPGEGSDRTLPKERKSDRTSQKQHNTQVASPGEGSDRTLPKERAITSLKTTQYPSCESW
jgi:hypothetical protein